VFGRERKESIGGKRKNILSQRKWKNVEGCRKLVNFLLKKKSQMTRLPKYPSSEKDIIILR
jgi:hypothetical protein